MNPTRSLLSLFLAAGLTLPAAGADVISLNIHTATRNLMNPEDVAGAPGTRVGNWNNIAGSGAADVVAAAGTLINDKGAVLPDLQAVLHPANNFGDRYAASANDDKMFACVIDKFEGTGFASYGYLDLTNIPYANYSIRCYFLPDNGSGSGNTRGGVWVITNAPAGTERRYIKNQDNSFTQLNRPANTGTGYLLSSTTSIPAGGAAWSDINGGNYAVFSGLTNSATRIWFSALGNGSTALDDAGNYVNGGSTARRFKICGFQVEEVSVSTVTNVYLGEPIPSLRAGSPSPYQLVVLADLQDGSTGVLVTAQPGTSYVSQNTNIFTVTSTGRVYPGHSGTTDLVVSYQSHSLTQAVTVLPPTAVYPNLSLNPLYVETAGAAEMVQATLLADFADATGVDVSAYSFITYSGNAPTVASVTASGLVTAVGAGAFQLTAIYEGVSGSLDGAVEVFTPPATATGAKVVSYDIEAGKSMGLRRLAGAPGVRVANWNGLVLTHGAFDTGTLVGAVDSTGAIVPGITATVNALGAVAASVRGTQGTDDTVMYASIIDMNENRAGETTLPYGGSTMTVNNIPFDAYRVYFYFQCDNATEIRPAVFQIAETGEAHWVRTSVSGVNMPWDDGSYYEEASYTLPVTNGVTLLSEIPYGNFVKSGMLYSPALTVNFGPVSTNWFADADVGAPRLKFSGFQIIQEFVPRLTATKEGTNLKLSWSDTFTNLNLMSSTVINQTWSPVGATPDHANGTYSVTVPVSASSAFFRLQSP